MGGMQDFHLDQVPGTIRYLARSGTWHDLVPGTTWQIWYLARSVLVSGHQVLDLH